MRWDQFFGVVTFVVGSLFVEGGELIVRVRMRVGRLLVGSLSVEVGSWWVAAVVVGILLVEAVVVESLLVVVAGILSVEVGRVVAIGKAGVQSLQAPCDD